MVGVEGIPIRAVGAWVGCGVWGLGFGGFDHGLVHVSVGGTGVGAFADEDQREYHLQT